MQIKSTKLNKDQLNGNKLFLHTFNGFSTTSNKLSLKMHIIHALFFILIAMSIVYVVLVISIIFNIVNKKEIVANINNTNVEISKIEKSYISSTQNLTKDYALSMGYVEAYNTSFVSRRDNAANLSFLYDAK